MTDPERQNYSIEDNRSVGLFSRSDNSSDAEFDSTSRKDSHQQNDSDSSDVGRMISMEGYISSASFHRTINQPVPVIYRNEYPITQINGCRQYGPPKNWSGKIPGFGCEIYVKRIPPDFTENELVPIFEQFGKLFELRLMMDYNNQNRRYCFVRYTTEEDAKIAIEVLNHRFVQDRETLEAQKSFEKCRLFVGNLPKDLDRKTIEVSFRSLFPEMIRFVMHNRIADGEKNRGFAFMDFPDHGAALRAKKQATPGCMRIWDREIKIVWANPQRSLDHSGVDEVKTLFVRNLDVTVNTKDLYGLFTRLVDRQNIVKISRVREFAFVEFSERAQAETVMKAIQGYVLYKYPLDVEWAMPPLRNTFHNMKNYDFDALLRLKCIANGWDLPIIIYGRTFTKSCVQYVAIILRNKEQVHTYFVEVHMAGLKDIQSRVCEALITLILEGGVLPDPHFVLKLTNDVMMLVGSVSSLVQPCLNLAQEVDLSLKLFWNEIVDLCEAAYKLIHYSFDHLYYLYQQRIETGVQFPYLDMITLNDRILGCLAQSFRCRPGLNSRLDNREIIFVLCDQYTSTNYNFSKKSICICETLSAIGQTDASTFKYKVLPMLPSRFVQANCGRGNNIDAVYFGINPYPVVEKNHFSPCYSSYNYLPTHTTTIPPPQIRPPQAPQMMFNPFGVPPQAQQTAIYGDVNQMGPLMQQLRLTPASLPPQIFYEQQSTPLVPQPAMVPPPTVYYNI